MSSYESIPGFSDVPKDELDAYFTRLGPAAVHAAACGVVDLDIFWDGLKERLPILSGLAMRYKSVIVNSADAERSNSIYKLVLSSRRSQMTTSKPWSFCTITRGLPVEHLRTKTLRRTLMSLLMRPRCLTLSSLYVVLCCVVLC